MNPRLISITHSVTFAVRIGEQEHRLTTGECLQLLEQLNAALADSRRPEVQKVLMLVADHSGVTVPDLLGRSRTRHICDARQVCMWLCRHELKLTLQLTGQQLNRDHGTIMLGEENVQDRLATEPAFAADLRHLAAQLQEALQPEVAA